MRSTARGLRLASPVGALGTALCTPWLLACSVALAAHPCTLEIEYFFLQLHLYISQASRFQSGRDTPQGSGRGYCTIPRSIHDTKTQTRPTAPARFRRAVPPSRFPYFRCSAGVTGEIDPKEDVCESNSGSPPPRPLRPRPCQCSILRRSTPLPPRRLV